MKSLVRTVLSTLSSLASRSGPARPCTEHPFGPRPTVEVGPHPRVHSPQAIASLVLGVGLLLVALLLAAAGPSAPARPTPGPASVVAPTATPDDRVSARG